MALTKEQNDANLAAIKAAQGKQSAGTAKPAAEVPTPPPPPSSDSMIQCKACHTWLKAGTKYCHCGAILAQQT